MIKSFTFKKKKHELKPGLNILLGSNGAGKSSILKRIAIEGACDLHEDIVSTSLIKSQSYYREQRPFTHCHREVPEYLKTIKVDADSACVLYFDGSQRFQTANMMCIPEFFKETHGMDKVIKLMKTSSGEQSKVVLELIFGADLNKVMPKYDGYGVEDWSFKREYEKFIELKNPRGCFIFDEPETFLDMESKINFWNMVNKKAQSSQVIVASHCFLALEQEAHFIELSKNYKEKVIKLKG